MELNRIYNEPNLETMARMPDGFIDLTVTSPPYDNLRTYNGYEFDFEPIARELFRVTKKGGVVVWVVGDMTIEGSESLSSSEQKIYFRQIGFNVHDTMIWDKESFRFPDEVRYYNQFEYMFVFSKGKPSTFNPIRDRRNIHFGSKVATQSSIRNPNGTMRPNGAFKYDPNRAFAEFGCRGNVWRIPHCTSNTERVGHPAQMNVEVALDQIRSWSDERDLVYDPFAGSGTTSVAAHQLGRRWIGSEISAEYVALANKRLEPYLMQEQLF